MSTGPLHMRLFAVRPFADAPFSSMLGDSRLSGTPSEGAGSTDDVGVAVGVLGAALAVVVGAGPAVRVSSDLCFFFFFFFFLLLFLLLLPFLEAGSGSTLVAVSQPEDIAASTAAITTSRSIAQGYNLSAQMWCKTGPVVDRWPLGTIDLFHLNTHDELRAGRMGSNSCALVAELDGRVDTARVRRRLAEAAHTLPELRWCLGRSRRFERVWKRGGPGPDLREKQVSGPFLDAVVRSLAEPIGPRAPWRLQLLHGAEHDALALTWFHPATDALGARRLLGWLGNEETSGPEKRFLTGDRLLQKLDGAKQRELTQAYVAHVNELGQRPILSLENAARQKRPGEQQAIRLRLTEEQTASFYGSLRKRAGLADTSLMLWAVARMVDSMMAERGFSPPRQMVPVPLSLDPKKGSMRMFGNHLTMLMLALDRDDLLDEATAVAHLAAQRRHIVRNKLDVGMLAAIRASRHLPRRLVSYISRHPFGGERSSYVLSNPGGIDMEPLFGLEATDVYAVPTVLPAPGFQVTIDGYRKRLSLMIMFRSGYVRRAEIEALVPALVRDLLP